MVKILMGLVAGGIVLTLGVVLFRFNRKRLHVIGCAKGASDEQLEVIYGLIDGMGTRAPECAVLARTNTRAGTETEWRVEIPNFVEPWGGRIVLAESGREVAFRFSDAGEAGSVFRGAVHRPVPVPRQETKSGKWRNQLSSGRYLAGNHGLRRALEVVCPKYPGEWLAYLLMAGAETFEFDPMFQARIGGSPSWVQDAEYPECEECRKRMSLVLQVPGALLPGKPLPSETFYFFAC